MTTKKIMVDKNGDVEASLAAMIVQIAEKFKSTIYCEYDGKRVNAKSIMGMMMLALGKGDEIEISADGSDESEAVEALEMFLNE